MENMIREYRKKLSERPLTPEEYRELEGHLDQLIGGVKSGSDQDTARTTGIGSIIEDEESLPHHD